MRSWAPLIAACAVALPCWAQDPYQQPELVSQYDMLYGAPVDVSLTDLLTSPEPYQGRAIRVKGRLDLQGLHAYALRDTFGTAVGLNPVPDIAASFDQEAMHWLGEEVQVTGLLNSGLTTQGTSAFSITFWKVTGPEPKNVKGKISAPTLTLESLVQNPGRHDGQLVRVVGKFRGRNLYGDLPARSQKSSADWVIKDDLFAVWVTGKRPKGSGWELDSGLKRDTGKWVEVIGRVESRGGTIYLRALQLELTTAPTATADAQPPPPPPERPKLPPVVVFALPLDGDQEVPSDARFVVQFSKDMNVETFKGRILMRYVGAVRAGDRAFDGLKFSYDEGRRALTVDPGGALRPGRQVEILLLPGIADLDGLTLAPRDDQRAGDVAAETLRYHIAL